MAQSNAKLMRAALKEALDLFAYEFVHADGRIVSPNNPNGGAQWVMQAREALGLDPITGKRVRRAAAAFGTKEPTP